MLLITRSERLLEQARKNVKNKEELESFSDLSDLSDLKLLVNNSWHIDLVTEELGGERQIK